MNVEFVKFYETNRDDERQQLSGTLHIRLPEIGINIKGINVIRKKDYWFIGLPSRKSFDRCLEKEVNYATFLFDEKEKNRELVGILRNEGRKFVEAYLESNRQAAVAENANINTETPKAKDSSTAPKETARFMSKFGR